MKVLGLTIKIIESQWHFVCQHNNFDYLKLMIKSTEEHSYFKKCSFIIRENCDDGTNEWLEENKGKYNLEIYIEPNNEVVRGGGGMDFICGKVKTEFINFPLIFMFKKLGYELLKVFDKYPSEPMMVFSHRVQPNIFNEKRR